MLTLHPCFRTMAFHAVFALVAVPAGAQEVLHDIPGTSATVTTDGTCATDTEYSTALHGTFDDGAGTQGDVYLAHDSVNLYVCMRGRLGTDPGRFVAVYLDPNASGDARSQSNDIGFRITLLDPQLAGLHGTGEQGWSPAADVTGWNAASVVGASQESAEFAIPIAMTGSLCRANFRVAVYHHWVDDQGDDHGWPSAQYYDQPQTWANTRLAGFTMPDADGDGIGDECDPENNPSSGPAPSSSQAGAATSEQGNSSSGPSGATSGGGNGTSLAGGDSGGKDGDGDSGCGCQATGPGADVVALVLAGVAAGLSPRRRRAR